MAQDDFQPPSDLISPPDDLIDAGGPPHDLIEPPPDLVDVPSAAPPRTSAGQPGASELLRNVPGFGPQVRRQENYGVYDTRLSPQEETQFQAWKQQYAPKDSGEDYDLRGAFKSGFKPDPVTGHWPDTFKKPNEPTFSNESRYAQIPYADAGKAGHWGGPNHDQYVPGAPGAPWQPPEAQPSLYDRILPPRTPGMPDPGTAAVQGIIHAGQEIGQTGETLLDSTARPSPIAEPSPAAKPIDFRHGLNFEDLASKLSYQAGHSFPMITGGMLYGTAAGRLTPGPPPVKAAAALAGGAAGASLATVIQRVGPAYAEELQKSPDNPDEAYERAWEKTGIDAAGSAAGWALFGLKFFKGPLKNLIVQAVSVQPAVSGTTKAAQNLAEGRPVGEGVEDAIGQSQANAPLLFAAHGVVSALASAHEPAGATGAEPPPSAEPPPPPETPPGVGGPARDGGGPAAPPAPREFGEGEILSLRLPNGSTQDVTVLDPEAGPGLATIQMPNGETRLLPREWLEQMGAPGAQAGTHAPLQPPDDLVSSREPGEDDIAPEDLAAAAASPSAVGMAERESKVDQAVSDRVLASANLFGDGANAEAIKAKGFDSLQRENQHVVLSHMRRALDDSQVFRTVVQTVPVDVMNLLLGGEVPTETLLHDKSVLTHALSVPRDSPVPKAIVAFVNTLAPTVEVASAQARAKEAGLGARPSVAHLSDEESAAVETANRNVRQSVSAGQPIAVNVNPTDGQKKAGNYLKGAINLHGMDIAVETPKGETRAGTAPDGTEWSNVNPIADYGEVKRTTGADGEGVDVYIGSNPKSEKAYVIDQVDPKTGKFDEHKGVVGADTPQQAAEIYDEGFSDGSGPERLRSIKEMPVEEFRDWAQSPGAKDVAETQPVGTNVTAEVKDVAAPTTRPLDDTKRPIFHKGERVVIADDGPLKGRHGTIVESTGITMATMFGGNRSTSYHYTVKTDEGHTTHASRMDEETEKPAKVVADPVVDGHPTPPHQVRSGIDYAKRNAAKHEVSAGRARKPAARASWLKAAKDEKDKASRYQAALDAWIKKNPETAKAQFPSGPEVPTDAGPVAKPAAPVAKATYTENEAKNGVEVRFKERPDDATLGRLKAAGFRWSKPQKLWYARRALRTLDLAKELAGQKPEPLPVATPALQPMPEAPDVATTALQRPVGALASGVRPEWTEIGKNARGQTLYEDQRGVRSILDPYSNTSGVPVTEPVLITPTRAGVQLSVERKPGDERWEVVTPTNQVEKQADEEGARAELDDAIYQPASMPITSAAPPPPKESDFARGDDVRIKPESADLAPARAPERTVVDVSEDGTDITLDGGQHVQHTDIEPLSIQPIVPTMGNGLQEPLRSGVPGEGPQGVHGASPNGQTGRPPSTEVGGGAYPPGSTPGIGAQGAERPAERPPGQTAGGGAGVRGDAAIPRPGARPEPGAGQRPPDANVKGTDYRIEPGEIAEDRGPKEKARDNLRAIQIVKQLQAEGRLATREEQAALAKYVGWGGLSGAFQNNQGKYGAGLEDIGRQLKEVLTDEEYRTAQRSTQYAHYTAEHVIRSMWDTVAKMGFKGGSVFEPGMGIGHFLGMMPPDIAARTEYQGVEMDHLTADIAHALYPRSGVRQADFTETPLPNNTFDLVIGNPPFADTVIKGDPKYAARNFMLHDYFFAKSMDAVRPGGLLAFVTSAGTMNKGSAAARSYLAAQANFLGGVRLPSTAFKQNAGTEVTTDILFFQKLHEGVDATDVTWIEAPTRELLNAEGGKTKGTVSRYFTEHPEMVLGQEGFFDKLYKGRYAVHEAPGGNLEADLAKALDALPKDIYEPATSPDAPVNIERDFSGPETKDGSYYLKDGKLWQYENGVGRPARMRTEGGKGSLTKVDHERILHLIPIRDALRETIAANLVDDEQAAILARSKLNTHYDAFVAKFGPINKAEFQYRRPTIVQQEVARAEEREAARARGEMWREGSFDAQPHLEGFEIEDIEEDEEGEGKKKRKGPSWAQIARMREEARLKSGSNFDEGSFNPAEMADVVIDKRPNIRPFMDDPESYRLRSIEEYNDQSGESKKKDIFFKNTLTKESDPDIRSANDGVLWSLNKFGRLDLDAIAEKRGQTRDALIAELGDSVFQVPGASSTYQMADEYLSGDIFDKLETAQRYAQGDATLRRNVAALEAAKPAPLPPSEIRMSLGMPWIPAELIQDFAKNHLGIANDLYVRHSGTLGGWVVNAGDHGPNWEKWSTPDISAVQVLSEALNRTRPRIYVTEYIDGKRQQVFDPVATQTASDRIDELTREFADYDRGGSLLSGWIKDDDARLNGLANLYNTTLNRTILRSFDGSYLTTPGVSSDWSWRPHQRRVVARIILSGDTYMAHAVGAGKTSAMIGAGMEMRRLGLVKKPMYVVPNHMLGQFTKEFYEQYPTAKIAVADERRFHTSRRKQFIANVAQEDLDAVIITHSSFGKIPLTGEFQNDLIKEQLDEIDEALSDLDKHEDRITVKKLENMKEKLEQRMRAAFSGKKDQTNTFEELGVDFLFADEAHCFSYDTLVATDHGPKKIGDIVENGLNVRVASYDHTSGKMVWRAVRNRWRHSRSDKQFIVVRTAKSELKCTTNHQVFVEGRGYVRADGIRPGDNLRTVRCGLHATLERSTTLLRQVPFRCNSASGRKAVRQLRRDLFLSQFGAGEQRQASILQPEVLHDGGNAATWTAGKVYQRDCRGYAQEVAQRSRIQGHDGRTIIGAHEDEKSDAPFWCQGKDAQEFDWSNVSSARRQWSADETTTVAARDDRVTDGVCYQPQSGSVSFQEPPEKLQGGFGRSSEAFGGRDRWTVSPISEVEVFGSSEDNDTECARVVGVEVLERGSSREPRTGGPEDQFVYDLGIEGEHNYFANGFLVHNSFRKLNFASRQNVKGIDGKGSDRSFDLYSKVRYLDSKTPGRSHVFASGTPVTNTMGELYTLSKYMQRDALAKRGLSHFDSWASAFGEAKTETEPTPQGTYDRVTRFAGFVNTYELFKMVGETMDIVTPQQLEQYVVRPKVKGGKRELHLAPKTDAYEAFQRELIRRVQDIKARKGPPKKGDDIILSVINDGRHAAIDTRFVQRHGSNNPAPAETKLNQMLDSVIGIYNEGHKTKFYDPATHYQRQIATGPSTQMIFSNLGVNPRGPMGFSGYDWMKQKLLAAGVPKNEIAFIGDYKTTVARQKLFNDMNAGKVRILIGSTQKMGTGVNAQRRLAAIHNLDPLWFPSDDEQRVGRGLRQGNWNPEIAIHDYATEGTYDEQMWQMMGRKARFIEQFMRGDPNLRHMEDVGEASFYEQASAMAASDKRVIRLTELRHDLDRLQRQSAGHEREQHSLKSKLDYAESNIRTADKTIPALQADIAARIPTRGDDFKATIGQREFDKRAEAADHLGTVITDKLAEMNKGERQQIAELGGFGFLIESEGKGGFSFYMRHSDRSLSHISTRAGTPQGFLRAMEDTVADLDERVRYWESVKADALKNIASVRPQIGKPFDKSAEIRELRQQVTQLEREIRPKQSFNSVEEVDKALAENSANYRARRISQADYLSNEQDLHETRRRLANPPKPDEEPKFQVPKATPTFYSAAFQAIGDINLKSAPVEQWRNTIKNLKGVKKDELDWLGLDEWLAQQHGKVEKSAIYDFLKANEVQIKEVTLGDAPDAPEDAGGAMQHARYQELDQKVARGEQLTPDEKSLFEWLDHHPEASDEEYLIREYDLWRATNKMPAMSADELYSDLSELRDSGKSVGPGVDAQIIWLRDFMSRWEQASDDARDGRGNETKFQSYTLPGGKNYREILMTLPARPDENRFEVVTKAHDIVGRFDTRPEAEAWAASRNQQNRGIGATVRERTLPNRQDFRSSHFDQPNILVHLRVDDRTDADGKKVLFVEEVQSDWHQAGRRRGYLGPDVQAREKERATLIAEREKMASEGKFLVGHPTYAENHRRYDEINGRLSQLPLPHNAVPDAPFKTTWQELGMKRLLRMAADGGYDRIAWTTGDQQAERYDLSKHVAELAWNTTTHHLQVFDHRRRIVDNPTVAPDDLADHIGKDAADKLVNSPTKTIKDQYGTWHVLTGLDLKIGGEGMRGFYDDILPKFMNKYVRKWGAKVGKTTIKADNAPEEVVDKWAAEEPDHPIVKRNRMPVHSIDITDAMRESVQAGQPMFENPKGWGVAESGLKSSTVGERRSAAVTHEPLGETTSAEQEFVDSVNDIVHRIAPDAEVRPVRKLRQGEEARWGMIGRQGGRRMITWSLEAPDAVGTGRHEAVHWIWELLTPAEKDALKAAADKEDWIGKHGIKSRYPGGSDRLHFEESVADEFGDYRRNPNGKRPSAVKRVFEKIAQMLHRIAEEIRRLFGRNATAADVFARMERGEVGRRGPAPDRAKADMMQRPKKPPTTAAEGKEALDDIAAGVGHNKPPGDIGKEAAQSGKGFEPPVKGRPSKHLSGMAGYVERVYIMPRTLATTDWRSAKFWDAVQIKDDEAHKLLHAAAEGSKKYMALTPIQRGRLHAVEELDRLNNHVFEDDGMPIVVRNDRGITRGEFVNLTASQMAKRLYDTGIDSKDADRIVNRIVIDHDQDTLRRALDQLNPHLEHSKVGDTIELDPQTREAYFERRNLFRQRWRDIMRGAARRLGWPGPPDAGAVRAAAEAADTESKKRSLDRVAALLEAMSAQERTGYVPLMRFGDYFLNVRPKPGADKESLGGFPRTIEFRLVDSAPPLGGLFAGTTRHAGDVPKAAEEGMADLRKRYPASRYDIDHGYLKPGELDGIDIPAIEKLLTALGQKDTLFEPMVQKLREDLYDRLIAGFKKRASNTPGYCIAPETRLLKADMTMVIAGDVVEGDELVGFEEIGKPKCRRKMLVGRVERVERLSKPCVRIRLQSGRTIIASEDHQFLGTTGTTQLRWVRVNELRIGDALKAFPFEEKQNNFDAGWLSGFIDGEGHFTGKRVPSRVHGGTKDQRIIAIGWDQLPGAAYDRSIEIAQRYGLHLHLSANRRSGVNTVSLRTWDTLRCLQLFAPVRLIAKQNWIGAPIPSRWQEECPDDGPNNGKQSDIWGDRVAALEYVGQREVIGIKTSCGTFIAEGICSHNSSDFAQATGNYMHWTAHHVADALHGDDVRSAKEKYIDGHPDRGTQQYWNDWQADQDRPRSIMRVLQQFGFLWELAGNPSSTVAMALHGPEVATFTLGIGLGASKTGMAVARRHLYPAIGQAIKAVRADTSEGLRVHIEDIKGLTADERAGLEEADRIGVLHSRVTDDLMGLRAGGFDETTESGRAWAKAMNIAGSNISVADRVNRIGVWLAAYRMAKKPDVLKAWNRTWFGNQLYREIIARDGVTPKSMARFMVDEALFVWGRKNQPAMQRRGLGPLFFQFHGYEMRWLSALWRNLHRMGVDGKLTGIAMMAGIALLAGAFGLPFVGDIEKTLEMLYRLLTKVDPMIEAKLTDLLSHSWFGKRGAEMVLKGPSRTVLGIDLSRRLGFGDVLTDLNLEYNPAAALGAVPGIIYNSIEQAAERHRGGQTYGQFAPLLPAPVRNLYQSAVVYPHEGVRTARQKKGTAPVISPDKLDFGDKIAQALGFQPAGKARAYETKLYEAAREAQPKRPQPPRPQPPRPARFPSPFVR